MCYKFHQVKDIEMMYTSYGFGDTILISIQLHNIIVTY